MDWKKQLHKLHIDMSSHCNASCPNCLRNIYGGETIAGLPLAHFDVQMWNNLIKATEDSDITCLTLEGRWGDPIMHPNLPEMLETFCSVHPDAVIFITTNGGWQTPEYWKRLATVLSENSYFHRIDFNIDGLADTNHLFRRGTNFNTIMENLAAFNDAGGHSSWIMHVYDYNKDQIETAREKSEEIGCMEFTTRRVHNPVTLIETDTERYKLTATDIDSVNYNTWQFKDDSKMITVHKKMNSLKLKTPCPWYNNGSIHIDPWGYVWPCNHISAFTYNDDPMGVIVDDMFDEYGEFNNLKNNSLTEILKHEWFEKIHEHAIMSGKWAICREECGACGTV